MFLLLKNQKNSNTTQSRILTLSCAICNVVLPFNHIFCASDSALADHCAHLQIIFGPTYLLTIQNIRRLQRGNIIIQNNTVCWKLIIYLFYLLHVLSVTCSVSTSWYLRNIFITFQTLLFSPMYFYNHGVK